MKTKIIVVGGQKGGGGKSTIAVNLAIMRSIAGKDILLIDADEQVSAAQFTALRNESMEDGAGYTSIQLIDSAVRTETKRLMNKHDEIIIDTGGRDTTSQRAALTVADILLAPFEPGTFDVWTAEEVSNMVAELKSVNPKLKAFSFINKGYPQGQDNREAGEMLVEEASELKFLDLPIINRKAVRTATSQGLAIIEYKPKDQKAIDEIKRLYDYLY